MRARRNQSGQILPIVALLMVVIMAMAAFAVDGSNLYSQHRRWQADLDVATKDAAAQLNSGTTYTAALLQAMSGLTQTLAQDGYPVSGSLTCMAIPSLTVAPCSSTFANGACLSTSGITMCNPPVSTPWSQAPDRSHYVQGTISYTVPGFFGSVIGLGKMHINVQAVAKHSGSFPLKPYAIIALNTATVPDSCAIDAQGGNGSSWYVDGSIRSNYMNCLNGGGGTQPITVTGSSEMCDPSCPSLPPSGRIPIVGQGGIYIGLNPISDPYPPITFATPPPIAKCYTGSNGVGVVNDANGMACDLVPTTCITETDSYLGLTLGPPLTPVTSTNVYYFGGVTNTVQLPGTPVQIQWTSTSPNSTYYLLPGCDGTVTGTAPGVFNLTGAIGNNGLTSLQSFSSTIVLDPLFTMNLPNPGQTDPTTNTVLALDAPGSGPYMGIALTQHSQPDPNTGQLTCYNKNGNPTTNAQNLATNIALQGNSSLNRSTNGIIDIPCATLKFVGNAIGNTPTVRGAIVANNVKVGASSSAWVQYGSQLPSLSGGAVLVY